MLSRPEINKLIGSLACIERRMYANIRKITQYGVANHKKIESRFAASFDLQLDAAFIAKM